MRLRKIWRVTERFNLLISSISIIGLGLIGILVYDSVGTGLIIGGVWVRIFYKWEYIGTC